MTTDWIEIVDFLAPLASGYLVASAESKLSLKRLQDSVLRQAYLTNETHHSKLRMSFISMVNGREKPLDIYAIRVGFILKKWVFFVFTVFLLIGLEVALALFTSVSGQDFNLNTLSNHKIPVHVPACAALWLICSWRLKSSRHSAWLQLHELPEHVKKKGEGPWTIVISASRAEDGLPTRQLEIEYREGGPGFLRRFVS